MAGDFWELLEGIDQYYGHQSDQWVRIARNGVDAQTIQDIQQLPGLTIYETSSGAYRGWDYTNPFKTTTNPVADINSNVPNAMYGETASAAGTANSFTAKIPGTAVQDAGTQTTTMVSGAKTVATGSKVASVAQDVALSIAAVAGGINLGTAIDSTLYSFDPEWWDEHFPSMNPETWDDIATTKFGKNVIRFIFGLSDDSQTMTAYAPEDFIAYAYQVMLANGIYQQPEYDFIDEPTAGVTTLTNDDFILTDAYGWADIVGFSPPGYGDSAGNLNYYWGTAKDKHGIIGRPAGRYNKLTLLCNSNNETMTITSTGPYTVTSVDTTNKTAIIDPPVTVSPAINKVVEVDGNAAQTSAYTYVFTPSNTTPLRNIFYDWSPTIPSGTWNYIAAMTLNIPSAVPGITQDPDATITINPDNVINPDTNVPITPQDSLEDTLAALKNAYPGLFHDEIYEDVPQPDGTITRVTYAPVPYPDTTTLDKPISGTQTQANPQIDPETTPQTVIDQLIDLITNITTAPPDTGEGDTPPTTAPVGSASSLYAIYNPSQAELDSFGAWLWSSNFVDQLKKLFNDPMQAIIGLHKVYATPATSGSATIKVGYLDSGVSAAVVSNQYTTIDCGSVELREFFGNVFDYDPYTHVYVYLPFIGIQHLDTGDVMRSTINIKYHVDVLTGACLAELYVTRDNAGGVLYTYSGNAACQYPISSGSYMGIVASIASVAGGVVGTIASGGAIAPLALGAMSGVFNAHTRVQHSGSFSGNAGAMGVKTPYLIVTRPQTALADEVEKYLGYPANKLTTIGECSGFVRALECHLENIPATDMELNEIDSLLKSGVIL